MDGEPDPMVTTSDRNRLLQQLDDVYRSVSSPEEELKSHLTPLGNGFENEKKVWLCNQFFFEPKLNLYYRTWESRLQNLTMIYVLGQSALSYLLKNSIIESTTLNFQRRGVENIGGLWGKLRYTRERWLMLH